MRYKRYVRTASAYTGTSRANTELYPTWVAPVNHSVCSERPRHQQVSAQACGAA
jgi:hypothetical protein